MSEGEDKGTMKPKGLNSIVNIDYEHLCLREKISEQFSLRQVFLVDVDYAC
jgi:hypothetical protein